ncbi:hypothetical protein N9L80_02800 [Luminiphilus sp.]|nr:hypothetical protein [Luminiphilus sp.]
MMLFRFCVYVAVISTPSFFAGLFIGRLPNAGNPALIYWAITASVIFTVCLVDLGTRFSAGQTIRWLEAIDEKFDLLFNRNNNHYDPALEKLQDPEDGLSALRDRIVKLERWQYQLTLSQERKEK